MDDNARIRNAFDSHRDGHSKRRDARTSMEHTPFQPAPGRFMIGSFDDESLTIKAQYNPKELQVDRDVKWEQKDLRDNRPEWLRQKTGRQGHADSIEYTGGAGRTMSFELIFDGYEQSESIEPDVNVLEELACVRDPDSPDENMRRPHWCVVAFGEGKSSTRMRCIIEKMSVKYSMFSPHGIPVRATVNITVREANRLFGISAEGNYMQSKRMEQYAKNRNKFDQAKADKALAAENKK